LFPYGQEVVDSAIHKQVECKNKKKQGKPSAWSVEDHMDYYLFKCMVDVEKSENINYSKSDGIIGVDCNVDHYAVSDVNRKGQLINSRTLTFNLVGKNSNQITKIMEVEAIELAI
jgi:transposase